ncbi:MAG: NYN domain-containing protein [Candidatus Vogelbacteria bacterium]|nr:NYN domain-containing protein [Candidatus Vogelbacteria bacterium]
MIKTYAFIDASNLFYGGVKSLGWKIDYQKLLFYFKSKYGIEEAFYFGGVEIHDFPYNYQTEETVNLSELERHLLALVENHEGKLNEAQLILFGRHLQRVRFYKKLESFGYQMFLKPVKLFEQEDETTKRKADCDVDMTVKMIKEKDNFSQAVVLSGDGDFLPALKYLRELNKEIVILARGSRTAREIRQFAGGNFKDFEYLRELLKRVET